MEGFEDLFGGLCPREGSWVLVPGCDPFANVIFQRDNAFVDAAFEQLIGEEPEPALDSVDPRRPGRGEVDREPRVFGQPICDSGGFVGGQVVIYQVHVELVGYGFVDGGEEFLELHRAGAGGAVRRSPCRR